MDKINRIKELVALLNQASDAYYNKQEIMTDAEYDALYQELVTLETSTNLIMSSSPTVKVGYEVNNELPKIAHKFPMLSLDKITSEQEILDFIGTNKAVMSLKEDGLSVRIVYGSNGDIKSLSTRGNGEVGTNITTNLCAFSNIPTHINTYGEEFIIDGEAICTFDNFDRLNESVDIPYKHPRAVSSGTVSLLNPNEAKKRRLDFIAWKFTQGSNNVSYGKQLNELHTFGFDVVPWTYIDTTYLHEQIKMLQDSAKLLSHPYDGICVAIDDTSIWEKLGATSHHPNHSKAYKFAQDAEETVIKSFDFTMGKTGQLTPTACFETVILDNTEVSKASCHNIGYCKNLKLGVGARVKVIKAMQIIPQIIECVEEGEEFVWPLKCPVCGGDTQIIKDNESEVLTCINPNCSGKLLGKLTFFVSKKAMDINNLSEATLEFLINKGWVHIFKDLYHLTEHKSEWQKCDGFGKKSVEKILDAIEKSRNVDLAHFITALSIPGIGSSAAKTISEYFHGDYYEFSQALVNGFDFTVLKDFGEITNKSLHDWWKSKDPMVELLPMEMHFVIEQKKEIKDNPFTGKSICCTGRLEHFTRDSINEKIIELGAKVASSVTSKTDFLINNDPTSNSSKNNNAKKFGTKIITEEEFLNLIGG